MTASEMFCSFLGNLTVSNSDTISLRYGEITSTLNQSFRDTDSKTYKSLQVGSYGRNTAIDGISDLDMAYIMPRSKWQTYNVAGGQRKLLRDVQTSIRERYPRTESKVDGQVVTLSFVDFQIEVLPVFEDDDGDFTYPDENNGGSWKLTKPRAEMAEFAKSNQEKNTNLVDLGRMARAWKNKAGLQIGGLLIDTLAYRFLESTADYDQTAESKHGHMMRDFFGFLSDEPEKAFYRAPGSNQEVYIKKPFQKRAKEALTLCEEAIAAEGQKNCNNKWRKVFGRSFPPQPKEESAQFSEHTFTDTEQHIFDKFPVDIRYTLAIDCEVKQDGFQTHRLLEMLAKKWLLQRNKALRFSVLECNVPTPYRLMWKVLNRGPEAERRDNIRGQIVDDLGHQQKSETTSFRGDHLVECYAIKEGVVVARDRIHVPIQPDA